MVSTTEPNRRGQGGYVVHAPLVLVRIQNLFGIFVSNKAKVHLLEFFDLFVLPVLCIKDGA